MAGTVDYMTTLSAMESANEDFVTLIQNLKALLTGNGTVTFKMGDYTITLDSIANLMDNYRNGKFESILIGGQTTNGNQIKLSVSTDGRLEVTDNSGNLAYINCKNLVASTFQSITADKVTANDCEISSIKGTTSISGGNIKLSTATASSITTDNLKVSSAIVDTLSVAYNINCQKVVCYGNRKLSIPSVRNVFYNNGVIDNFKNKLTSAISSDKIWSMSATVGSPKDLGFTENVSGLPGMVCIQGMNSYKGLQLFAPTNIKVGLSSSVLDVDVSGDFPRLIMWPTGYVDEANNRLVLTPFTASMANTDIYYMTAADAWSIYRTMTIADGKVTFGEPYTILPYSCVRFISNIQESSNGSKISILELA